jgi:hypothetical protein
MIVGISLSVPLANTMRHAGAAAWQIELAVIDGVICKRLDELLFCVTYFSALRAKPTGLFRNRNGILRL